MIFTFKCQCVLLVYTSNPPLPVSSGNHLHMSSQQYAVGFSCTTSWSNFERRCTARLLPFVSQELLGLGVCHREGTASPVASRYGPVVY